MSKRRKKIEFPVDEVTLILHNVDVPDLHEWLCSIPPIHMYNAPAWIIELQIVLDEQVDGCIQNAW